jgi:hypothetical protein
VATVVSPALGNQQSNIGIVENSTGVVQSQYNIDAVNGYVEHQDYTDNRKSSETTYINVEAPVDMVPNVNMLDVGTADVTYLIYPMEAIATPVHDNVTYSIRSAVPVAVYIIKTENEKRLLDSSESMLTYDPVYHVFRHGAISPSYIFPHFTTKCTLTMHYNGYIVVDNRYFPDYGIVEIAEV